MAFCGPNHHGGGSARVEVVAPVSAHSHHSGAEAAHETVDALTASGEKVGIVKVRLYRPFDGEAFVNSLPATVKSIAVLDRTKEPGSLGEPLYMDCITALHEHGGDHLPVIPKVIGGNFHRVFRDIWSV